MTPIGHRDPRIVAAIGIAVIAALLVGVLNINRLPFIGEGDRFQAAFADAAGLEVGDAVTIAGITVGRVDHLELDGGHVVATFSVSDAELPAATRASIEIKTLLGQHHLALQPTGSGALEPDSRIPLSRTTTPLNIVPALQQTTRTLTDIDTDRLASAMDTLSEVVSDTAPEVRGTLRGLSRLSQTISSRDAELKELFQKARAVTGTLASRNEQVSELIASSNVVLRTLHQRKDTIRQLLRGTRALTEQLTGLVRDNKRQLGPTLHKLNEVLAVLKHNENKLDGALTQLAPYARTFTNVVGSGQWFDTVVKLPRGFAVCDHPPGNPVSELIDPVLSDLNQRITGSDRPCLPLGAATDTTGKQQGGP